jgi:hypothetical protein
VVPTKLNKTPENEVEHAAWSAIHTPQVCSGIPAQAVPRSTSQALPVAACDSQEADLEQLEAMGLVWFRSEWI